MPSMARELKSFLLIIKISRTSAGTATVRRWFDTENVDVIADISNSGVALAINELAKASNKIVLNMAASSDFTGKACSPVSFQWDYNTHTNSVGLVNALVKQGM